MTGILLLLLLSAQSPADAMKAFEEGNAAYAKQENEAALGAFDRAIALDPKNPDFHHARCRTLARLQRHADGVGSCTTALTLRPDHPATLIDRGHFYINMRRVDLALADLMRVHETKREEYGLFYHLALAHYLNGDFARAADAYEGCVRSAPTPDNRTACQAWQYLALIRANRVAEAGKLLDSFTPDPKQTPSAYIDRLLLFKGVKTEEEVARTMEKDPVQRATVGYSVGVWHLLNGREQKAREYFEKALAPPAQQSAFGAVASHYELKRMKPER